MLLQSADVNWPLLFIPAALCLLLLLLGSVFAIVAAMVLRKARKTTPARRGSTDLPPLIPNVKETALAPPRRSLWGKCLLACALLLLLAGLGGLWATRFSIGWMPKSPVEWSDGQAPELEGLIRQRCVPFINRGKTVGMAVAVVTSTNATVMAFGRPALCSGGRVRADTVFEIGSITKTFTGLALAREIERGTVRLDQPVQELLPADVALPPAAQAITLRHLASHSSGFPRVPANSSPLKGVAMLLFGSDPYAGYTEERLLEDARTVKLEFKPGSKSAYSNFGMILLGHLLARKTACRYEELVKREVCQPLGMNDTAVTLDRAQAARIAQGYRALLRCGPLLLGLRAAPFGPECGGAGALRSTGADLLKYLQANMRPEGQPLEHALRESHRELSKEDETTSYGLNWVRTQGQTLKQLVIWHNGGTGGFRSFLGFAERSRVGVMVLSNSSESVDALAGELLRDLIGGAGQSGVAEDGR